MTDVRRRDNEILTEELLKAARLIWSALLGGGLWLIMSAANAPLGMKIGMVAAVGVTHFLNSYRKSLKRRFYSRRFEALWNSCVERLSLFDEVRLKLAKDQKHDWEEMPKTVERVAKSLYLALRRADIISHEVQQTEKGFYSQPSSFGQSHMGSPSHDSEAKDLYQLADKNIAEYRNSFAMVMAGVHRTEAQCAVFVTTVDTLRMKLIGYRLVGNSPEMSNVDFLDAMTEAKLQLSAIDSALDELELGAFRQQVGSLPPLPPEFDSQPSQRESQ